MDEYKKVKILGYTVCFLIIFIGVLITLIAWLNPGPDILLSIFGGGIAGLGTVEVFKLRKLFYEEEI